MDAHRTPRRHNRLHSHTVWHRHSRQPAAIDSTSSTISAIDDADQDINILILGDRGSGKTCLNSRYVLRQFVNTGAAAQLTGGHKLVTVEPPLRFSSPASSSSQVHLIVQDFPCGPWQETIDNRVPDGSVPLTGDYIYATLQSDFRQSLLTRADAVMLVCNPWSRSSFEWIGGAPHDAGGGGGIVDEVLEAASRKNLTRRVQLLLDALSESTSTHYYRSPPAALGRPAPQIAVALPGDERRNSRKRIKKEEPAAAAAAAPYDFELEYPVLVVGTASDRLTENGGDMPRTVRKADGHALARRFQLHGGDGSSGEEQREGDADARKADGTLYTSRYMEVSARTGDDVDEAFMWLIRRVLEQRARARERKKRQEAVAAVRRRVVHEMGRESHQSCRYWMAAAAEPLASLWWASREATTAAVQGCFGASPQPAVKPPVTTDHVPISHPAGVKASLMESHVESRSDRPFSKETAVSVSVDDDRDDEMALERRTDADADTVSLPSLVTDTTSLHDATVPDGSLARADSRGPRTPVAVGPVLGPDDGMGKARRAEEALDRHGAWVDGKVE